MSPPLSSPLPAPRPPVARAPALRRGDVKACSAARWQPPFAQHAFGAAVLGPLPRAFVEWLVADGVYAAEDSRAVPARTSALDRAAAYDDECEAGGKDERKDEGQAPSDDDGEGSSSSEAEEQPRFLELEAAIDAAIGELGGAVMPKLNWSAPKDAVWLSTTGSVRCTNAEEVLLLLKASDAIAHDVCDAFHGCIDGGEQPADGGYHGEDIFLVLRRWHELRPAMHFRCFVRRRTIVGACQRDPSRFYPFLLESRVELGAALQQFVNETLAPHFELENVVADVYIQLANGDRPTKCYLVDFNPAGGSTLPLMFEWEELGYDCSAQGGDSDAFDDTADKGDDDPDDDLSFELRLVEEEQLVRPGLRLGVPHDMVDASAIEQAMRNVAEQQRAYENNAGG